MFEDSSDNIKVAIRIRPSNQREIDQNSLECIYPNEENLQTSIFFGNQDENKQYTFDYIAHQNSTQLEIFQNIGFPLANYALEGYNVCLFAYGQTGTGKTHTMYGKIGDEEQEGLQTRMLKKVFNEIQGIEDSNTQILTHANYFEIYNENIIDLLSDYDDNKQIQIREDVKKGVYVDNLHCKYLNGYQEAMESLNEGNKQRHIASTKMNLESSRSHSVFQFHIQQKTTKNGITSFKNSKINFVDLAGSERQKQTQASGDRLKEATNINKSLSILGRVINQLVEKMNPKKKGLHIPYRDSKLTFLLKDSLGGNAKTVMIATVTASDLAYQESLSTLKFAQRAKQITNKAEKNEETSGSLALLQKEIKILKKQIEDYKLKVKKLEIDGSQLNLNSIQNEFNDERLNTLENEQIRRLDSKTDELDLLREIQNLKDQLALKENELNLEQIKFQDLQFNFQHSQEQNRILEKQLNEMKQMMLDQEQTINSQKDELQQYKGSQQEESSSQDQYSNNLLVPSSQNKMEVSWVKSQDNEQKIEKLEAENNFLQQKLEKFYKLQKRFMNQSQLRTLEENQSKVIDEDPFLDLATNNEELLNKLNNCIDENNELKNDLNKLNEDNDTLRQTIFYISTKLNEARRDRNQQQSISNPSCITFNRNTMSIPSNHEYFKPQNMPRQSNSNNNAMLQVTQNTSVDDILNGFDDHDMNYANQKIDYFQYYSDIKHQILIDSVKEMEKFYTDKNIIVHNQMTVYVFIVWQRYEFINLFVRCFKEFCKKINNQSSLVINLMGNKLNDEQFRGICENGLSQIKNIKQLNMNISHNDLSNDGMIYLGDCLSGFKQLESLKLNIELNHQINGQGIQFLTEKIRKLSNLQNLQIEQNQVKNMSTKIVEQQFGKIENIESFQIKMQNNQQQKPTPKKELKSNYQMDNFDQRTNSTINFNIKDKDSVHTSALQSSKIQSQEAQSQRNKKSNKSNKKNEYVSREEDTCKMCTIF